MRNGKNRFYRKLKVDKETREAIRAYKKLKKLMLTDLAKKKR